MTLLEFRENAPEATGYREELLKLRKSLPNAWDYNAYVGILLGVSGPKHGDPACSNYAIGQGDNGNNTKLTLERRGLMPLFQKYKGKQVSPSVTLSEVEDEIVAEVPEYQFIREQFHVITGQAESGIQVYEQRKAEPTTQTSKVFSENKSSGNRNIDDKKLKFASHSERVKHRASLYEGDDNGNFFNFYGEEYGGALYLTDYGKPVFKVEDGAVTVIKSDSKYFDGEIAVNCHGIFRRPRRRNAIYLFDESGNLKKKISLKENNVEYQITPRVYVYDNFIYEMHIKTNDLTLYRHDITGGEAERIWSYTDNKTDIFAHCEEYMDRTNIDRKEFQLGTCVRLSKLCANDRYVIVGVDIRAKGFRHSTRTCANDCMNVLLRFDLDKQKTYVINVAYSIGAYYNNGAGRENVDEIVLGVDMAEESVCFICPSDNGGVKCIEKHMEENGAMREISSHIIPKGTTYYREGGPYIDAQLRQDSIDKIAYIAGKSVLVGIWETMSGYIYRLGDQCEGNPRKIHGSFQSRRMEIFGDSYVYYGMNNGSEEKVYLHGTESREKGLHVDLESMKAEVEESYEYQSF